MLTPVLFLCNVFTLSVWQLDLQLPVQPVPITTKAVSSNPIHGEVYSIQHYVIKFGNDLHTHHINGELYFCPF